MYTFIKIYSLRFFFTLNVGVWALLPSVFIIPLGGKVKNLTVISFRFLTAEFQIKMVIDREA